MSSSPYAPTAKLLNQIWEKRKGLKALAYNRKGELTCTKATYAQCAHVLQAKPLLDRLSKNITANNKGLLYVLLYELLLGPNKSIRGGGALKRHLTEREEELKALLEQLQASEGLGQVISNPTAITIPRYIRVNTMKTTTIRVVEKLRAMGINFFLDPHIPDVLVLPPTPECRAQIQDMVTSHQIILQDKSSCFSALCLVFGFEHVERDGVFLDACASPGNKTSHLAALLTKPAAKNTNTVHALDKASDRCNLLQQRMGELVGPVVSCHNLDFFETSSKTFKDVRAILLDPSCSGSGMTSNHMEATRDPTFSNDRVKSLAKFQFKALKHATTAFADVTRVVYSTCSLYVEENERVVQRFLQDSPEWTLVAPKCLTSWKRRGIQVEALSEAQANAMIRVHPDFDASHGFFVACLQKQTPSENRVLNEWVDITPISSVPFYNNEFHPSGAKKDEETLKKSKLTGKRKAATAEMEEQPTQQKSSKPDQHCQDVNEGATASLKNNRKREKKLEWKQKQRERKAERIAAKNKSASKMNLT